MPQLDGPDCEAQRKPRYIDREANLKAYRLLRETIGEDSFMDLVANKSFPVVGRYGTYEIDIHGQVFLHQVIDIGEKKRPITWGLCVSATDKSLPEGDRVLALFLSIKNHEDNFVKEANFRNVTTEDEYSERRDDRHGYAVQAPSEESREETPTRDGHRGRERTEV
jgi:hypothetical protein